MSWFKRKKSFSRTPTLPKNSPSDLSVGNRLFNEQRALGIKESYDVFTSCWNQACAIMDRAANLSVSSEKLEKEEVDGVLEHLDNMFYILVEEKAVENEPGLALQLLLRDDIMERIWTWCCLHVNQNERIKLHCLKLFDLLMGQAQQAVFVHKEVIRPLLKLLSSCSRRRSAELEYRLVVVLNQLCVCLTKDTRIIELLFTSSDQGPTRFVIFSLLIPFVHRDGSVGQQARDALLLLMALSAKQDTIGQYIARQSDFCPVLATGLSGLYSGLPRTMNFRNDDWCQITNADIASSPEIGMFLNSLEFCNAVIQVAHNSVREQLLLYIYNGFLMPVIGPALHQNSMEEVVAATAYLELCVRKVTDPALIQTFLRFLLAEAYDEMNILESLVIRINSHARLAILSLQLFRTLVSLKCEDVIFQLILRYLIPLNHLMLTQRRPVRDTDRLVYIGTAEKLLSMRPFSSASFAFDQDTIEESQRRDQKAVSEGDAYSIHLQHAREKLLECQEACTTWSVPYDGDSPTPHSVFYGSERNDVIANVEPEATVDKMDSNDNAKQHVATKEFNDVCSNQITNVKEIGKGQQLSCDTVSAEQTELHMFLDSLPELEAGSDKVDGVAEITTLLEEMSLASPASKSRQSRSLSDPLIQANWQEKARSYSDVFVDFHRMSAADSLCQILPPVLLPALPPAYKKEPNIGPFLTTLFGRLESMPTNSLYLNLQLTGVISQLAIYPQPLLRSFLLNDNLVFQPTVKSLLQVLSSVKHKLDVSTNNIKDFPELVEKARSFLSFRLTQDGKPDVFLQKLSHSRSDGTLAQYSEMNASSIVRRKPKVLDGFLRRNAQKKETLPKLENATNSVLNTQETEESIQTKNTVYCAIVMDEFLLELAAISQEQALLAPFVDYKFSS